MIRLLLIWGWLAGFVALVFFGEKILPEVMSFDSQAINRLIDAFDTGTDLGSYGAVADFFALFPPPWDQTLIVGVGVGCLALFLRPLQLPQSVLVGWYLTFPAIISGLVRMQKEIVVVMLAMAVWFVASRQRLSAALKVGAVLALYVGYAVVFERNYFFIIAGAFAGIMLFAKAKLEWRLLLVIVGVLALVFMPVELFDTVQGIRDRMNVWRIGVTNVGYRTAFMNPWPVDSTVQFLGNYVYALVRLNVPVFFHPDWKSWYWLSVVIVYLAVLREGYRGAPKSEHLLLNLFVAHGAVLVLFEPDTGTYTRHITSVFSYVLPGLVAVDRRWLASRAARRGGDVGEAARENPIIKPG